MKEFKQIITDSIKAANNELSNTLGEKMESLNKDLQEKLEFKLNELDYRVGAISSELKGVGVTASAAYDTSDANLKSIGNLTTRVAELERRCNEQDKNNAEHKLREQSYKESIEQLQTSLDDQINRSMRSNLVFTGLNETEKRGEISTRDIVADFIFNKIYDESDTNITLNYVNNLIVRAHRGKYSGERSTPRPIFVKFSRDDVAAFLLWKSIEKKVSKNGCSVRPQHTKPLQERINKALAYRRELFDKKEVTKAFVEYPATLKGILSTSSDPDKYTVIKTF